MSDEAIEQPAHFCKQSQPYLRFAFYTETLPGEWYLLCWNEAERKFAAIPAMWCMWCGIKLSDKE